MSVLGPIVVVTETSAADLVGVLGEAGAFPIIEANHAATPAAITEIQPAALVLADPGPCSDERHVLALIRKIQTRRGPIMPVLMRMHEQAPIAMPFAVPVAVAEPANRIIARLRSALRVRTLHTTVLRRIHEAQAGKTGVMPPGLLDHATVLCLGRGRSYPALTTAIGEQVGLIGTLSVESAAYYLRSRDVDGVVIGDGFGPKVVEALVTVLAEEARFRDLPVGVFGNAVIDEERLPNLFHIESNPTRLVDWLLPLVRLQAFAGHLNRTLRSIETEGTVDSETGLVARKAFWHELDRAVREAEEGGSALSVARFSFEDVDHRSSVDAARLFSRLIRNVDFACQEEDGAILAAFTQTDLRSAHVVARRLANALRQTMLSSGRERSSIKPTITLATLKASDNLSTLVARVGTYPSVAAR